MNKYQEALSDLSWLAESDGGSVSMDEVKQCTETLQELVDRSKLAKGSMSFGGCYCNNCDYRLGDHNGWTRATVKFCSNCGKPLDWSNDEPTK